MKSTLTPSIHIHASIFALLLLMAAMPGPTYAQTLFDATFNNPDWTSTVIPVYSSPSAQCGHPAPNPPCVCGQDNSNVNLTPPSRRTCLFFPYNPPLTPNPPSIWVAHLYQPPSSFYDPSTQGAIAGVSYSYDLIQSPGGNGAVTHALLLYQNNTYYRSNQVDHVYVSPNWQTFPLPSATPKILTAADFQIVDNTGNTSRPDFSCTGKVIQFGYLTGISSGNNFAKSFLDNWRVDIKKGDCPCLKQKGVIECGPGGSYTYIAQVQNQTGAPIQQIYVIPTLPAGVTVTQQVFPVTLPHNGIATLKVTINAAPPGSKVCLRFSPAGLASKCCSADICFFVPKQGQC